MFDHLDFGSTRRFGGGGGDVWQRGAHDRVGSFGGRKRAGVFWFAILNSFFFHSLNIRRNHFFRCFFQPSSLLLTLCTN